MHLLQLVNWCMAARGGRHVCVCVLSVVFGVLISSGSAIQKTFFAENRWPRLYILKCWESESRTLTYRYIATKESVWVPPWNFCKPFVVFVVDFFLILDSNSWRRRGVITSSRTVIYIYIRIYLPLLPLTLLPPFPYWARCQFATSQCVHMCVCVGCVAPNQSIQSNRIANYSLVAIIESNELFWSIFQQQF